MTADIEALTIGPGSEVLMHFSLSLADGTVADSTNEGEPLRFVMGDGTLIEGLELVLYGLKQGDRQCLSIEPRDAFGFPDEENIHTLPRSEFPADIPLGIDWMNDESEGIHGYQVSLSISPGRG